VHIYADNQEVATTNASGNALVPRLRAYENNPIRIEQGDLPLDAEIDTLELKAIPALRSGVVIAFPVRRSFGGLITIVLDDGQPVPAGAVAQIVGRSQEFPTGMNGQLYLTGLAPSNQVRINWRGQACELMVLFVPTSEPLPQLGTYVCTGVQP
jgi:outer membrane usher protein